VEEAQTKLSHEHHCSEDNNLPFWQLIMDMGSVGTTNNNMTTSIQEMHLTSELGYTSEAWSVVPS
jgi:hypothetical protein